MNPKVKIPGSMKLSLRQARILNSLTQEQAANALDISIGTLVNYEKGKSFPDIPILRNIEKVYGVHYNQIIFLPLDFGLSEQNDETDIN